MQSNFAAALARVLVYEGGKCDVAGDPGGRTNQGITQATYSSWLRSQKLASADVYNIKPDQVTSIYKTEYWDRVDGDSLPTGLDLVVFDAAVNSGPGQAIKWLQAALGNITVDGIMGNQTTAAIAAIQWEHFADTIITKCCSLRLGMLQRLNTWKQFGAGWTARVANVQEIALQWEQAGKGSGVGSAPIANIVTSRQTNLGGKAVVTDIQPAPIHPVTASKATVVATIAAGVATALPSSDASWWTQHLLLVAAIVLAVLGLVVTIIHNRNSDAITGKATAKVPSSPAIGAVTKLTEDLAPGDAETAKKTPLT